MPGTAVKATEKKSPITRIGQLNACPRHQIDDKRFFSSPTPAQYHGISAIREEDCLTTSNKKAAIYVKKAAGYPDGENSKDLQIHHCEEFCHYQGLDIVARYHDPTGVRKDFDRMMSEATQDAPPSDYIVVYKLCNFS